MTSSLRSETQDANGVESDRNANPLLTELRRRLSEPGQWARRFQRLAEAIAESDDPDQSRMSLDCEECDDLLDLYVDDELAGQDVQTLHSLVWHHLQACTRCRQAHDLIADTLRRERDGELLSVSRSDPLQISFLRSPSAEAPWHAHLRSLIDGADFSLVFSFNLAYLHTLLLPQTPVTVRAEEPLSSLTTHLLLSDSVLIGDQRLVVEVTAIQHLKRPECLNMRAVISSSSPISENLWASLTWGGQTHSAPVDVQGAVDFGEVSLVRLQEALESDKGKFEIAFEVRD